MPGTRKTTSAWSGSVLRFEPSRRGPGLRLISDDCGWNTPRNERNKPRIGLRSLRARWDNFSFQSLLSDRFEHHVRRDSRRIIGDCENIRFQIDIQGRYTRKP